MEKFSLEEGQAVVKEDFSSFLEGYFKIGEEEFEGLWGKLVGDSGNDEEVDVA